MVELGIGIHGTNPETGERYTVESGRKAVELGLGIHGTNPETGERYAVEGGRKMVELGIGIHGTNPETGERYAVESGRIGGRKVAELGIGIHGTNPETGERYAVEGGRKAVELGLGFHSLTEEEKTINGKKSAVARGLTPWGEEETEFAYLLSLEPEYQHQKGPQRGKSNIKKIRDVLNENYHNRVEVRSVGGVGFILRKYIKSLGK